MLSYRHNFHAGNFADVHKHIVLTLLLKALQQKEAPLCYLDTHGGAGCYDLEAAAAKKNREHHDGILRIWSEKQSDTPPPIRDYLNVIKKINTDRGSAAGELRYYPGSPLIVQELLRPQDRMVVNELHSSDFPPLSALFSHDSRVAVHHQDGYLSLKAALPPKERRGLVLIDPAFELKDEFERCVEQLAAAWQRWPTGVYALWYPLLTRTTIKQLERRLLSAGLERVLISEIAVQRDDVPRRLNGSGVVIVNPPWKLATQLSQIHAWLWKRLAIDPASTTRLIWLAGSE